MMKSISAACVLALATAVLAQDEEAADPVLNTSGGQLLEEQAAFDVERYGIDLKVDPAARTIDGTLTMDARLVDAAREIALHLDDKLQVKAVRAGVIPADGGEPSLVPATWKRTPGLFYVDASTFGRNEGETFRVEVDYGGVPHIAQNPPWDGGFTWSESDGQPWFVTSCQGEGADLWWPCKDHPSDKPESVDLAFTVPAGLVVATNGRHLGEEPSDDGAWVTSRWRVTTPISNYAVALNVGPYTTVSREVESVVGDTYTATFWVLEEHAEEGAAFMDEIVRHLKSMEHFCGPYPFRGDKYGVVETPHLGMEHQSIIAYGNGFNGDPNFDYDWLHHHELSHEWWGNLVTARDWADFWIHEGIGTYMQALYLEEHFGREAYDQKMKIDLLRVLNRAAMRPQPPRTTDSIYFAQAGSDAPGGDIYFKGSWVMHSLRWLLGDEDFFRVLRRWAYPDPASEKTTDGSAVRLVDTAELVAIAEEVTEKDLGWFFEVYTQHADLPRLTHEVKDGLLTLAWEAPNGRPFPMPVEVEIGETVRRVELPDGRITFEIGDEEVDVDPNKRVLRAPR